MGGIIKAQAGSLVRSLAVAALPVSELQTRRIPALGAVSLAASGDGLFVTATSLHATIRTWIDVAEAAEAVACGPVFDPDQAVSHQSLQRAWGQAFFAESGEGKRAVACRELGQNGLLLWR